MKKIHYLAAVFAIIAAPAFAEKTPVKTIPKPTHITVEQCNMEKIQMLLAQTQYDLNRLRIETDPTLTEQQKTKLILQLEVPD